MKQNSCNEQLFLASLVITTMVLKYNLSCKIAITALALTTIVPTSFVPTTIVLTTIALTTIAPTTIGLHHPLDGVTNSKYKLLPFLTKFFCKAKKALTFNQDRCVYS